MVPLQFKDPIVVTIHEEKGIYSRFLVSISAQYDLSCWKQSKKQFLPSFDSLGTICEEKGILSQFLVQS